MFSSERVILLIGAVVAVLLQVLIAPFIAIGYGMPNFIAVFCLVMAIVQPTSLKHVLPFVMGLAYDLVSGGPVGAMAFSLTAFSAFTAWFFQRANNDTLFMGFASLALGLLLVEVIYGLFFLLFGYSANFLEAFAYRVLPCFAYDMVLMLLVYPIALRFLSSRAPLRSEITQLH